MWGRGHSMYLCMSVIPCSLLSVCKPWPKSTKYPSRQQYPPSYSCLGSPHPTLFQSLRAARRAGLSLSNRAVFFLRTCREGWAVIGATWAMVSWRPAASASAQCPCPVIATVASGTNRLHSRTKPMSFVFIFIYCVQL